jgi:NADPH:quinone reductase-like Zn-dependent oxidoreductase
VKAVTYHEHGGPEVFRVEDVPEPTPGAGEVVVRVRAAAINHLDVDHRQGSSRFPVTLPHIGGIELVGEIARIGAGVEGWHEGDRVAPYLLGNGSNFVGVNYPGAFAEYATVQAGSLVRLPDAISWEAGAALQVAFGTAFHMLFNRAKLKIGETVMINSVGSGIGSAAVQLAKLAGAYVIGNSSGDAKLAKAAELGQDVGVNYRTQDLVAEVMAATGGKGVDVVFEHVGGEMFQKSLDVLAGGGRLVTCGGHAEEVVPFDIIPFFRAQKSVIGSFVYDRDEFETCVALCARGQITSLVDSVYSLDATADAFRRVESREHFGKVVIKP